MFEYQYWQQNFETTQFLKIRSVQIQADSHG